MIANSSIDRSLALAVAAGPAMAVLLAAALVPPWRAPIAVLLVGVGAAWWSTRRGLPLALAAVLPVAASLSWPAWLGADVPLGPLGCVDPLAMVAIRRVIVAIVVVLLTVALVRHARLPPDALGLGRPSRRVAAFAIAGGLVFAAGGLVVGPAMAEPFFGRMAFDRPAEAILPALTFGLANGFLEELAYRGVLLGALAVVVGRRPAIVLQAVVFGIVHVGPEVTALVPVHAALMASVGLLAGVLVDRTRSLAIPIGIHVGADVALYFGVACRGVAAA